MNSTTTALILEGSQGRSFFISETLLAYELIEKIELVSKATEAIKFLNQKKNCDLIVIDLLDTLYQGRDLEVWLRQHPPDCPVILIAPPDVKHTYPPFIALSAPLSLQDFAHAVRTNLNGMRNQNGEIYDYS